MHDPRIALRRLRINGLQLVEQTAADGNLSRVSELWESCFSTRHGFWGFGDGDEPKSSCRWMK